MKIISHRIYDAAPAKGYRVLVDRLWPRGITKEKAALDEWCKDLAPSAALRVWFNHDPEKWRQFGKDYTKELRAHKTLAKELLTHAGKKNLILLYGAKDTEHNQALVLKKYLESLASS